MGSVVTMAFSIIFHSPCQYGGRLSIMITLLLTLVSLHNQVVAQLPHEPYR
jgi:hypothetical protein